MKTLNEAEMKELAARATKVDELAIAMLKQIPAGTSIPEVLAALTVACTYACDRSGTPYQAFCDGLMLTTKSDEELDQILNEEAEKCGLVAVITVSR